MSHVQRRTNSEVPWSSMKSSLRCIFKFLSPQRSIINCLTTYKVTSGALIFLQQSPGPDSPPTITQSIPGIMQSGRYTEQWFN